MYAYICKSGADFSTRCAHPAMQPPIFATHPRPLIRELTLRKRPSCHIGPGLCTTVETSLRETPSSHFVLLARYRKLLLQQALHCDHRLLSVSGGGGFLWWCVAYPALGAILFGSHGAARVFSPRRF